MSMLKKHSSQETTEFRSEHALTATATERKRETIENKVHAMAPVQIAAGIMSILRRWELPTHPEESKNSSH